MNSSQPIDSTIQGVSFGVLTSTEILNLSVKRITNPTALDSRLHPVPGGLHDLALGAFLDNPCATCHSNVSSCPGHCGHIELPVKVFNCTFMDQAYRLLRSQCLCCQRLMMKRQIVKLYCGKLQLLRYGLLNEAEEFQDLHTKWRADGTENGEVASDDSMASGHGDEDKILEMMDLYVRKAVVRARRMARLEGTQPNINEAVIEARKNLIRRFFLEICKSRACPHCKAINPKWRKNRYTSIFKKPLLEKEIISNRKHDVSTVNPLVVLNEREKRLADKKAQRRAARKLHDEMIDEGVADLDDSSPHEELDEADFEAAQLEAREANISLEQDLDAVEDQEMRDASNGSMIDDISAQRMATKTKSTTEPDTEQTFVNANEAYASLAMLFKLEEEIFSLVYSAAERSQNIQPASAAMFFIEHMVVPPNTYRKEQKTGPEEIAESADNSSYRAILASCDELFQILREVQGMPTERSRPRNYDDLQRSWLGLQDAVNSLLDRDRNPQRSYTGRMAPEGVKQKLEKKEGMFRMNIMGKRVNFAARSVISPDPNIETNEIGIPPVFALKLTYPEPVTQHNFHELKQAVINGAEKWPGAASVEMENGQIINLRTQTPANRVAIANRLLAPSNTVIKGSKNKKVHRHLNDGDIVIMNRQPTLHKPSMMAHRARVLQGEKTIRMHYANCKTYNADFDGDEMNMHFPQNEIARAEALQIADTDHQYISATAGEPLRGLIQDHISISVFLTNKDTFYNREDYQQLLYAALRPEHNHTNSGKIKLIEPAMIKPRELWTGKQIITTILSNIVPATHDGLSLISKSSTAADRWGEGSEEGQVVFHEGYLVSGILDKKQIGPSAGGFVHMVYEAYGHIAAGQLMSILGRLLTKLLNMHAFSCGVEDLILTDTGEVARSDKLRGALSLGLAVASKYVSLDPSTTRLNDGELLDRLEAVFRDPDKQAGLDTVTNAQTGELSTEITKACLPRGLVKSFPKNQMQAMTTSGAKGTPVNANLISCNLGQQVLEGRRVPTMVSGKTLPSFKPFETSIRAGGYIVDRFLTGVRPQEYYFHAMAGREGLIDTAVKTSRSGYLQRCLVKGMEGLVAEYDATVRDEDGTMIQTLYGEDGLDIARQRGINNFKFVAMNQNSVYASLNVNHEAMNQLTSKEALEWNKSATKKIRKTQDLGAMDPAISVFPPGSVAGSTSEKFYRASKAYLDDNPDNFIRDKKKDQSKSIIKHISRKGLEHVMNMSYLKSIIQPGEAIGVVAAQSVGEPSTQMTLNTFHLAGHSAKNVTLGIPRLREILMTASQHAKTPTMSMRVNEEMSEEAAKKFAKGLSKLSLAAVIDQVSVTETIGTGANKELRKYSVKFDLYPADEYCEEYNIKVADVVRAFEQKLVPTIVAMVKAEFKKHGREKSQATVAGTDALPDIGKSARRVPDEVARPQAENEGGDSDDDEGGDDDATNAKRRSNMDEGTTYEDPDEDEEAIAQQGEREASPDADSDSEDSTYGGTQRKPSTAEEADLDPEHAALHAAAKEREGRIKDKHADISSFHFDDASGASCSIVFEYPLHRPKLLFLPFVERAVHRSTIQIIPGIGACTYSVEELTTFSPFTLTHTTTKTPCILTEGANLLAMSAFQDSIDPHSLSTNDIGAVLRHYGVEAARATIARELAAVFASHAIDVDPRHLALIADYMTRNGGFQSFSRTGMRCKPGVFGKMSFETTVGFLREAVLERESDSLVGPSARITVGRTGRMGTGACDVFKPSEAWEEEEEEDEKIA